MNIRQYIFLSLTLLTSIQAAALTVIQPSCGSSSTAWHSDGSFETITTDNRGGATIWNSRGGFTSVTSNGCGGYTIWD